MVQHLATTNLWGTSNWFDDGKKCIGSEVGQS